MTDTSEWGKEIEITDDRCPHTILCSDGGGCQLVEVSAREIDSTHEWVMEECQRDGCDGRRWFRRQYAAKLGEFIS